MNRKRLFVLPLSVLLVGCQAPDQPSQGGATTMVCKTQSALFCKGEPAAPTVVLNTKNGQLKAKPGCVSANNDSLLIFRLTPKGQNAKGTVEIKPKDDGNKWLAGKNSVYADLIMIPVPKDLADGSYHYGVKTATDCLDPRVRIEN